MFNSSTKWDQFETNKALFGVETTFNEELYTTKLERGPQMREREREAYRIAREIEGQQTRNPHLAEVLKDFIYLISTICKDGLSSKIYGNNEFSNMQVFF